MKKKTYTAPECEIFSAEPSAILAGSGTTFDINDTPVQEGEGGNGTDKNGDPVGDDRWGVQW